MIEVTTVEMHTGGEPVRIVTGGFPQPRGASLLEKRRYTREHLDEYRRMLMFEPRGHFDMYGVLPVEPDLPEADLAVLFMHNEGYSTMCGHATIALGRWAVDQGLVARQEPSTSLTLQVPAGPVRVVVDVGGDTPGTVRFESVPSFAFALDLPVDVPGFGTVPVDVAYGGAFYAIVPADRFGLDLAEATVAELVEVATDVTAAVTASTPLRHPDAPDLEFLYGTILTDGNDEGGEASANVCVFADSQVDRSPTGSGVTARLALQHARGQVARDEIRHFSSLTGAEFTGRVGELRQIGDRVAVVVEVAGKAYYTGECTFRLEPDDPLPGFLIR